MSNTQNPRYEYIEKVRESVQKAVESRNSDYIIEPSQSIIEETGSCFRSKTICLFSCMCYAKCPNGCSTGCSSGYCHTGTK